MSRSVYFQTIINASPDIIVLKDAEGRWLETNKSTLEIFGLDEDVIIGKSDFELGEIYPHYRKYVPYFLKSDRQTWEAKQQIQAEEIVVIDGVEHVYDVVKVPIYDAEGNRDCIVVLGRDITELLKSEQRYKSLFSDHPDGVYSLDIEGNLLDVNPEAERMSGYQKEELLKRNFHSLIALEKLPLIVEGFDKVLTGRPQGQITQMVCKDGQKRDIQLTIIPAALNGKVIGIHGIAHDVTEREKLGVLRDKEAVILAKIAAGDPLAEILAYITEIVEKLSDGICSVMFYEKEHNCLRFGYGPRLDRKYIEKIDKLPVCLNYGSCGHAAYTKEITIVTDIETDPSWSKWSQFALSYGLRSCWSIPILSTKGSLLGTFAVYYNEIRRPENIEIDMLRTFSYILGLAIDRNIHEQEIQYLAHHDVLTNLPNLRYLKDTFPNVTQETQGLAVMFLDLDQFKALNDAFGHDFGDLIIQEAAKRIKETIGESNVVVRMGGDEFIMLIRNMTDKQMALSVAEEILRAIEKPISIRNREIQVTASIGISMYAEHGDTIEHLMKNADVAMYSVKDLGGNSKRMYDITMNEKAYELYMLQGEFRHALKLNQFHLHYQPKVDIKTGIITGVEALARWKHPEKGYISPATFIPLAEESGFILELGTWVLREACQQVKKWKEDSGLDIRVAVNVSVKQFIKQDVAALVKEILEELELSPSYLEIEITESVLISYESLIQESVAELQKIGVKVSIDDFGTGYASLAYLKQFQANTIKIDRSFIHMLPRNQEDAAIVSAVITLAKELDMSVIAEGVETKEQLDFLIRKGCSEVQGYYYSAPIPPESILQMLSTPLFQIGAFKDNEIQGKAIL